MSRPMQHGDDRVTLEEYLALPESDEYRFELSRGRLVREPAPVTFHGRIQTRFAAALDAYEAATQIGITVTNVAFILPLEPPTVRVPDNSFIRRDRIPAGGYPKRLWRIAPDLAIEILSPANRPRDVQEKVVDYLEAGVQMVWIIDPDARTATVYRHRRDPFIIRENDSLDGADVLPGLSIALGGFFRP